MRGKADDTLNYETDRKPERLPFCRNCGSEVDAKAKFCPNCAAPQFPSDSPATPAPVIETPKKREVPARRRPNSILVISILTVAAGVALIGFGGVSLFVLFLWLGALFLALGIVSTASGYFLFKRRSATPRLLLANSIGFLVLGVLFVLGSSGPSAFGATFSSIGALCLVYGGFLFLWGRSKGAKAYLSGT